MKTFAALLALLPMAAHAVEKPKSISGDGYVCEQEYAANVVTYIHLEVGRETTVEITATEQLQKVSASDSLHLLYAMIPDSHIFWLKPTWQLMSQPLTVISKREDGSLRTYLVQVDASDPVQPPPVTNVAVGNTVAKNAVQPCYLVRYTYPGEEAAKAKAKAKEDWQKGAAQRQEAYNAGLLRQNTIKNKNDHYVGIGAADLAPDRIFDDGYSTFLEFWGNRSIPAPFKVGRDHKDKHLTGFTTIDGICPGGPPRSATCLKLHSVEPIIRLRDQEDEAGDVPSLLVFNRAFNAVGNRPATGTSSPYVERQVRNK